MMIRCRRHLCTYLLCTLFFSLHTLPLRAEEIVRQCMGQELDRYLETLSAYGYSFAAFVSTGDGIEVQKGYGYAEIEHQRPFTERTPFLIASLTKQFIATGILVLDMQGKLSIDDPITEYVRNVPKDKTSITIYQLLTHTAGLAAFEGSPEQELPLDKLRDRFVSEVLALPLEYEPGTQFSYSNAGYSFLAALIEYASGQSLAEFMRRNLFMPADMADTGFITETDRYTPQNVAHGYQGGIHECDALLPFRNPYSWTIAIAILTTAEDFGRWETALRNNTVLSPEATKTLFTPNREHYACGWAVGRTLGGRLVAQHDGAIQPEGFNCFYLRFPEDEAAIIVLSNDGDRPVAELMTTELMYRVFDDEYVTPPAAIDLDAKQMEKVTGRYTLPQGHASVDIRLLNRALEVDVHGQALVDCFVNGDAEALQRFREANAKTLKLMAAIDAGCYSGVKELLEGERDAARWEKDLRKARADLVAKFGAYEGFELMHSAPEGPEELKISRTYVRLNFSSGSTPIFFDWCEGTLFGITDIYAFLAAPTIPVRPGRLRLVPQSEHTYATFQLLTSATTRFDFKPTDGSAPQALELTDVRGVKHHLSRVH